MYEEPRSPTFPQDPNFCGLGFGDVNGDGAPDLHFTDYNTSQEDRLLINDGNGNFADESSLRMTNAMLSSSFGTHSIIAPMNNDAWADVVKSENGPIKVIYNGGTGFFNNLQNPYSGSAYFTNVGDLNNDGLLDIIASDDGTDRYLLNQGGGATATFTNNAFQFTNGLTDEGFGSSSLVVDIDKDGWNDVVIADVDVDAPGCGRHAKFFHNHGTVVGGFVPLVAESTLGIGMINLQGTFDAAVFDINGDTFPDVVLGKCNGTQVWINQPPYGVAFGFPSPLPDIISPEQSSMLHVQLQPVGGATPIPGQTMLHYRINGAAFQTSAMTDLGDNESEVATPDVECLDSFEYYFSSAIVQGGTFTSPPFAPDQLYSAVGAVGQVQTLRDSMEDEFAWTVVDDPELTTGTWQQAEPIGTIVGGFPAAPFEDAESEPDHVMAAITENCIVLPCNGADVDVDGGPTDLISPAIDLAGTDADIRYSLWFFTNGHEDALRVSVSNDDGQNWAIAQVFVTSTLIDGVTSWTEQSFRVSDFLQPTSQVRVRFRILDNLPGNVVEGGVDNFRVEELVCSSCNTSHCCDQDQNAIRDDGCMWCECDGTPCNGLIQQIPVPFADMGGAFGACDPDGVADSNDRFHALNCFSDLSTDGGPGYPCEANPPAAFNVDAGGSFGDCNPDGVCDANDAFHALNAFDGSTACSCPADGPSPDSTVQPPPRTLGSTGIVAEATRSTVRPGDVFEVDVFLDAALDDLRGYQLHAGVTGGRRGSLELIDIVVDPARSPAFGKLGAWSAFNVRTSQMAVGLDQAGVATSAGVYLATFVYRASDDAVGHFAVSILAGNEADQRTFLFPTPARGRIDITQTTSAAVVVEATSRLSKRTE
jgi:hypothetical protein